MKSLLKEDGSVLIATLLILLLFMLLALALLIQTATEYTVAKNEHEAVIAFQDGESGLEWARREIIEAAGGAANLTDLLNGPDDANASDDNLLGLRDLTLTDTSQFTSGNEKTASAIVTRDFGDGSKTYEAFRVGVDEDGDTAWDGPRALVFVRIDDNYDEYPGTNDPLVDDDRRISATTLAEYPIVVDSSGAEIHTFKTLIKWLRVRIGPENLQAAIVAEHSLKVNGNPDACGECGSIHANDNLDSPGNARICENFTAAGTYTQSGNPTVDGDKGGGFEEIPVPVINPYDDVLVPRPNHFDGIEYSCNFSTPKYFALVPKLDGSGGGLIFKAYWVSTARPNNPDGGWKWRLIDDLSDNDNTRLDDCGRVVSGTVGGLSLAPDSGADTAVNDKKNDEFYGIKLGGAFNSLQSCSGDESLCATCDIEDNDFNITDFYDFTTNAVTSNANYPLLPGSFHKDNVRDFSESKIKEGNPQWDFSSNVIYSPLYNAVLFVYGEMNISGNPGEKICTAGQNCANSGSLSAPPGNLWKVSFIAVGKIGVSGNPSFAPANSSGGFAFMFVSGREVLLGGNAASGRTVCGSSDACEVQEGDSPLYAGIIAAHEQVKNNGDYSFDGFMFIEDAIDCSTHHTRSGGTFDFSGNPKIHYDCLNPPNPWTSGIVVRSWQEIQ